MSNKTALVVGAAGGVGLVVTQQLLDQGWQVIATVLNAAEQEALNQSAPGAGKVLVVDLSNPEQIPARLQPELDELDAVVVCAAIGPVGALETMSLSHLRKTFDINSIAAVAIYQACMPALRRSKGRIVFTSSFSGKVALPCVGAYSGSKFALEGLGDAMRREAAPFGVNIVLVEPGGIDTPMVQGQIVEIERARASLNPEMLELYGGIYESYAKVFNQAATAGLAPATVAQTILDALAAEQPEPRYVVGDDAQFMCGAVAAMPDREADTTLAGFLAQLAQS